MTTTHNTPDSNEALEPCPFISLGGKHALETKKDANRWMPFQWIVMCWCGATGPQRSSEIDAIQAWNSRASVAAVAGDALTNEQVDTFLEQHKDDLVDEAQLERVRARFNDKAVEQIVEAVWRNVQRYDDGEIWLDTLKAKAQVKKLLPAAASSPAPASPAEPPSCAFCDSGLVFNEREIAALSDLYERTGVSTAKILKHALALYQSHIVQGWEIPLESKLAPAPSRPEGEQEG